MDQAISIRRPTLTQDAGGGTIRTLATVLTGVQCAIQSASAREQEDYMRRGIMCDNTLYCVADLDSLLSGGIKIGDIVVDQFNVNYAVTAFRKELNGIISSEPLYQVALSRIVS